MRDLLFQGKTMETFFLLDKTGFVLKSEEFTAAAYLPRSPYFAARDRRPNPFASGKPILPPTVADLVPATVASPPHIPDNPPPSIPIVPLAEETPSADAQPSPSTVSEHLNLLDSGSKEAKKIKSRPSTKAHTSKPSTVTSDNHPRDRTRSLPNPALSQKQRRHSKLSPTRYTVVVNPEGFTYTYLGNVRPKEDTSRNSS